MKKTDTHYYRKFSDEMILRDFLALDRTILANKRTFLAYARTFIGLVAGGIGMVKLVVDGIINIIGYAFVVTAFPVLIVGISEYIKMKRTLDDIGRKQGAGME